MPERFTDEFLYKSTRVATNLEKPENLEYSGNSLNPENSWDSQGILCNHQEIS